MKKLTIGIPAFKAHSTIERLLSSINVQSFKSDVEVIIVNDDPEGADYKQAIAHYPDLDIKEVRQEVNMGPGAARDRALKESTTNWITWIDSDDIFYTPYAIEILYYAAINNEANTQNIMVQSTFCQEVEREEKDGKHLLLVPVGHPSPWVFAKCYNTEFLKANNVDSGNMRAMEDAAIQYQCRLLTEGTPLKIITIQDITYVWKAGSEHSITRVGTKLNNNIPLYNYGNCQLGAILSAKYAIKKVLQKQPFCASVMKFAAEQFVGIYFTYFEALEKSPMYAPQLKWLAIWSYKHLLKEYAPTLPFDSLEQLFMAMSSFKFKELKRYPPQTWQQWYEEISKSNLSDIDEIHNQLPEEVRKAEESTGVFKEPLSVIFKKMEGHV